MSATLRLDRCVVRRTHAQRGRRWCLDPSTSDAKQLHYGRLNLEAGAGRHRFSTGRLETGLIALRGQAEVATGGRTFAMAPYDALYVPRDAEVEVWPAAEGCDLAEVAAPVERVYPLQFVAWSDVQRDPGLHFKAGAPPTERMLNVLIGKNVEAGRILAGVTFSTPGNWTSWPPHEHAQMLEEAYLYIDMPAPSWGIQLVYTDPATPELVVVVREGDVVLMPHGYHPNVSAPGASINFLWMMAAHREGVDRQFGVVNVQPEYADGGSGLEPGRAAR
ncbi:MAG TPA: 5-deoxy-glucuronate isomerase [Vicinamibacteria bacterium]|nr:5-deoxy-glucuronate isomerase [Vicinamibacteria bacterium]